MSDKKDKDWDDEDDTTAASYDFVRFTLADIHGIARHKLIPRHHVADRLQTGITMSSRMSCLRTTAKILSALKYFITDFSGPGSALSHRCVSVFM